MASPAAVMRARVQAAYPGAIVKARGQKWITHQIGRRVILDTSIGPIHKADGVTEINSDWVATTGAWQYEMTGADFSAFSRDTLGVGTMYRFQKGIDFVEFQPLALNWVNDSDSRQQITQPQSVVAQVVNGDTLRFPNGYGTGRHFEYETQTARLQKRIIIDSAASLPAVTVTGTPYLEIEFIIGKSAGVTEWVNGQAWDRATRTLTTQRIEYRTPSGEVLFILDYPRAWDSVANSVIGQMVLRRQGQNRFVMVRIPKSWIDMATFPIVLDPTVGDGAIEVGSSTDDAGETSDGSVDPSLNPLANCDGADEWNGWRFTGITIPSGSTIDVSYLTVQMNSASLDEPDVTFFGEDNSTPATFASGAGNTDISERTRTTASVDWSNTNAGTSDVNTSDLSTIVQELVDSYSYSNAAMVFVMRSRANDISRDTSIISYDGSTTACARLHIEYTESGVSVSATLTTGAATLSATANRRVNTSGALSIAQAVLAGDVDIARTLSGALNIPASVLAASVAVTRTASAALIVPASVLSAAAAVTRNVSGDLAVPPATLSADLDVARFVAGVLNLPVSVLAADIDIARSVAAALNLPASALAADVTSGAAKTVAGTLQVAGAVLAADVDVQRTASGALIVTPAVLNADASVIRSASGAIIVAPATLAADVARTVSTSGALTLPATTLAATVSVLRLANGALALAVPVLNAVTAGEQLTASAALVLPVPVIDADAMVSRTASGALTLSLPVLDGDAARAVNVQGVLVLEAPTLAAQLAIARLVSGDLELPAAILAAQVFLGAVQSVIGLRASVTQGDTLTATVTAIKPSATVH